MGQEMLDSDGMTEGTSHQCHGHRPVNRPTLGKMPQGILMMRANSFVCDGVAGMQISASRIHMTGGEIYVDPQTLFLQQRMRRIPPRVVGVTIQDSCQKAPLIYGTCRTIWTSAVRLKSDFSNKWDMSVNFLKIGLFALSCIGLGIGFLIIFSGSDPSNLCGKSCQIIHASINIFGKDATRFFVAAIWIAGGGWFGYMAIRLKKR